MNEKKKNNFADGAGRLVFTQDKKVCGELVLCKPLGNRQQSILLCVSWWRCGVVVHSRRLRGQRQVEVGAVEEEWPGHRRRLPLRLVQQLEQSCTDVHGNPHDDALGHSCKQRGGGAECEVGWGGGAVRSSCG